MNFSINLKPLSINDAYRGRHFKTAECRKYERDLAILLPKRPVDGLYFRVQYDFYLVRWRLTDQQNLLKILTDCIVRNRIIPDDRFIVEEVIRKFPASADRIEVNIEAVNEWVR